MDKSFRMASRRRLEEAARLDRAAGAWHGGRDARIISKRFGENLPRLASFAAVHVFT
jgi:hypothetical protein